MLSLRRSLPGLALALCLPAWAAITAVDFSGPTNPWPNVSRYAYSQGGAPSATVSWGAFGTIDTAGGVTPSPGLRLDADGSGATGYWGAALTSGWLTPPVYGTSDRRLITLAFMLKASSARPVLLRLESFASSGARTGRAQTLIHPAAPDFWQRYTVELSELVDVEGAFDPFAAGVQIVLEIGSGADSGAWPFGVAHWVQLDNIHLAGPAYYVRPASEGGSDSASGRSPTTALATVQRALDLARPGDTVLLMDGEHGPASPDGAGARFRRPGTPAAWITLRNHPGHAPVIRAGSWHGLRIRQGEVHSPAPASLPALAYLEIRGLTIRGLADTLPEPERGTAGGRSNANGIAVDGRYDANFPHDIRIAGNHVLHCTGGGVAVVQADWVWLEDNLVHDTSHWTIYAASGISLYQNSNYDGSAGALRALVRGNRVFGNETRVPWAETGDYSDGNGIIIDDSRNGQNRLRDPFPRAALTGRFLVSHNLAHDNSGSGIHAFQSDRVDLIHNTVWSNSRSPHLRYLSLGAVASFEVRMLNNIVVAAADEPLGGATPGSANVVLAGNVFFGGDTPLETHGVVGYSQNHFGDPRLVDPARGDFRLLAGSPALASALVTVLAGAEAAMRPTRDRGAWTEVVALEGDPRLHPPFAEAYAAWAIFYGAAAADLLGDPDGDGLANLLEYALDLSPLSAGGAGAGVETMLQTSGDSRMLALGFTRARTGLVYTVEASSDLVVWSVIATNPGGVGRRVTVPDAEALTPGASRRFLRLRVAIP